MPSKYPSPLPFDDEPLESVYPEQLIPIGRAGSALKGTSEFLAGNEAFDRVIDAAQKPYATVKEALRTKSAMENYATPKKIPQKRAGGLVKPRGVGKAVKGHGKAMRKQGK